MATLTLLRPSDSSLDPSNTADSAYSDARRDAGDASNRVADETPALLAQHRAETERVLAGIRQDFALNDGQRVGRISHVIAEANARVLALAAAKRQRQDSRSRLVAAGY